MRSVFYILSIFMAVLVLLLSLAGIAGAWFVEYHASRVAVEGLARVDEAAQRARNGIGRVNTRVTNARETVITVEAAITQISQNVAEAGLVATLLPEETMQRLDAGVQQAVDTLAGFRDALLATINLIEAIDSVPLVNLPQPDAERVQKAGEVADDVQARAQEVQGSIRDVRAGAAEKISSAADAASRVDNGLAEIQADLNQVDNRLAGVQDRARQLQQTIPTTLIIIAAVSTVLLLWVAYTQVVVLLLAWRRLRAPPLERE